METEPKLSNSKYQASLSCKLQSLKTTRTLPTFSCEVKKRSATLKGKTRVCRSRRAAAKHPAERKKLQRSQHVRSRSDPSLPNDKLRNRARCRPEAEQRSRFLHLSVCPNRLQRKSAGSVQEPVLLCEFWLTGWDWRCWSLDAAGLQTKRPN